MLQRKRGVAPNGHKTAANHVWLQHIDVRQRQADMSFPVALMLILLAADGCAGVIAAVGGVGATVGAGVGAGVGSKEALPCFLFLPALHGRS